MTDWPTPLDCRRATEFGYTTQPEREGSHLSLSHVGQALTSSSHVSTMWSTRSSGIPRQRWWWATWTDWHHTWGYSGRVALRRDQCNEVSQRSVQARPLTPSLFVYWLLGGARRSLTFEKTIECSGILSQSGLNVILLERVVTSYS
jgi:hypothetical protein